MANKESARPSRRPAVRRYAACVRINGSALEVRLRSGGNRRMLETNIRIVETGTNLCLQTRVLEFEGSEGTAKTGEIAVSFLRRDRGLASIVSGNSLLALTSEPVRTVERKEGQRMVIRDTGRMRELKFSNPSDRMLLANLLERQLELQ